MPQKQERMKSQEHSRETVQEPLDGRPEKTEPDKAQSGDRPEKNGPGKTQSDGRPEKTEPDKARSGDRPEKTGPGRRRRKRRAWVNDVRREESGKYVYEGVCYAWRAENGPRGKVLARLWMLAAALAAAVVTVGCIPAPGMENCGYLILPYALEVVAAVSVCWGLVRISAGGDPLREYVYHDNVEKLPGRCVLTSVLAALTAGSELVYAVQNGMQGGSVMFALLLALECAAAAASLALRARVKRLVWERC